VVIQQGAHRKELSGGFRHTTNNRMELMAVIVGLQALKAPSEVSVMTDSKYVSDAVNLGWARRWRANNWKKNKREKALNPDLWETLLELCERHQVSFTWVRGHAGHTENERCDRLAVQAANQSGLPPDIPYEQQDSGQPSLF
jgi:ribonuclease HI